MSRISLSLFLFISIVTLDGVATSGGKQIQLSNGRFLGYQEFGSKNGDLVLYFHGINSSRIEAELIEEEICKSGVRLISIDRPGIGNSTHDPDREILDWPGQIVEFLDALGYGNRRFGIVCVSGGASYGFACAIKIPHRISHLAVISGYSPFCVKGIKRGMMDLPIRLIARHPKLSKVSVSAKKKQIEKNPRRATRALSRGWIKADKDFLLKDEAFHQIVVKSLKESLAQDGEGLLKDIALLRAKWGFEVCEVKNVPVSIWSGGADPIVTPSMAWYFHTQVQGSKLVIGSGEGHATMLKNFAPEILKQVKKYL